MRSGGGARFDSLGDQIRLRRSQMPAILFVKGFALVCTLVVCGRWAVWGEITELEWTAKACPFAFM